MFGKYKYGSDQGYRGRCGLFVAAGLAALFVLAMQVSNLSAMSNDQGYEVVARFENVGGLKVRSPVSGQRRARGPGVGHRFRQRDLRGSSANEYR